MLSFNQITLNSQASNTTASSNTSSNGSQQTVHYDNKGNDFLDPDKISNDVSNFSGSIKPGKGTGLSGQLIGYNVYGKNPDQLSILNKTTSVIKKVNSANFGSNVKYQVPVIAGGNFTQAVPNLGNNPDATKVLLSTQYFVQNIPTANPTPTNNNTNPLNWESPRPVDVLNGVNNAQSSIFGGTYTPATPSTSNANPLNWHSPRPIDVMAGVNAAQASIFGTPVPPVGYPPSFAPVPAHPYMQLPYQPFGTTQPLLPPGYPPQNNGGGLAYQA